MIVCFDPETLVVEHVITLHPEDYHLTLAGTSFLMTRDAMAPHEIKIERHPDTGAPVLKHAVTGATIDALAPRRALPITAPERLRVGEPAIFAGVPEGVGIAVNGANCGVMDGSGSLEFTAENAGFYRFAFAGFGWMTKEIDVEAVAG